MYQTHVFLDDISRDNDKVTHIRSVYCSPKMQRLFPPVGDLREASALTTSATLGQWATWGDDMSPFSSAPRDGCLLASVLANSTINVLRLCLSLLTSIVANIPLV